MILVSDSSVVLEDEENLSVKLEISVLISIGLIDEDCDRVVLVDDTSVVVEDVEALLAELEFSVLI